LGEGEKDSISLSGEEKKRKLFLLMSGERRQLISRRWKEKGEGRSCSTSQLPSEGGGRKKRRTNFSAYRKEEKRGGGKDLLVTEAKEQVGSVAGRQRILTFPAGKEKKKKGLEARCSTFGGWTDAPSGEERRKRKMGESARPY